MYSFLTVTPPKSLFLFFCKCAKNAQGHKKLKYENSTIKRVLKICQTCPENYFMKLIFPKICTFYVSNGQKTTLTEPKEFFIYIMLFDSCLIMKNWNPQKRQTLLHVHMQHRKFMNTIMLTMFQPGGHQSIQ